MTLNKKSFQVFSVKAFIKKKDSKLRIKRFNAKKAKTLIGRFQGDKLTGVILSCNLHDQSQISDLVRFLYDISPCLDDPNAELKKRAIIKANYTE